MLWRVILACKRIHRRGMSANDYIIILHYIYKYINIYIIIQSTRRRRRPRSNQKHVMFYKTESTCFTTYVSNGSRYIILYFVGEKKKYKR